MTTDELRAIFEAHFPLPNGVTWIGEHYSGCREVMGSFRNASEWDAMFPRIPYRCEVTLMLVHVHVRNPDGSPGRLIDAIEREPRYKSSTATYWIMFDHEEYPVLTGVTNFIVIPEDRLQHIRELKKVGARVKK